MYITLTSFGSQTLHNGTSFFSTRTEFSVPKAQLSVINLPGGGIYDPWGTSPAPTLPGKIKSLITIVSSSKSAMNTAVNGLTPLIGKRETLSGTDHNNTPKTTVARLETVEKKHPFKIVEGYKTRIELTFQLYEDWA